MGLKQWTLERGRLLQTPALLFDLGMLRRSYLRMCAALPGATCYYAVKANPYPDVLRVLAALGSGFEISSSAELRAVARLGIPASRVISSNPIKAADFIAEAWRLGIDRFAVDSRAELRKLAQHAPPSRVYIRLAVDSSGSEYPLTKKHGVSAAGALQLVREAPSLGLKPYGLAFHVGSQCTDKKSWASALLLCHELVRLLAADGIALRMISLGGGFPVPYTRSVPAVQDIGRETGLLLGELFSAGEIEVTFEPGRALVGEAGMLVASVIGTAERGSERWAYLDAGVFNGLFETSQGFQYRVGAEGSGPTHRYVLAGPSCDSADILAHDVPLPELGVGDRVYFLNTGAYTLSYASHFNGFPPPTVHIFDSTNPDGHLADGAVANVRRGVQSGAPAR